MKARNVKPGFFKNELLGECNIYSRMLFIGLWCMASREGVVEYRPKKIKAEIFPYENGECDVEKFLEELRKFNFISVLFREGAETPIIVINKFAKHQNPHRNEKSCGIDDLGEFQEISGNYEKLFSPLMKDESGMMKDERGMMNDELGEKRKSKRFSPPTLEDIKAYCLERKNNVDPERWFDFYQSNGWMVGRNKMKDFKATIRNWERNDDKYKRDSGKQHGFSDARKSGETDWTR